MQRKQKQNGEHLKAYFSFHSKLDDLTDFYTFSITDSDTALLGKNADIVAF